MKMEMGIDIVEAERFANIDHATMTRMFTEREIEYIMQKNNAPETIAGIYASKEAFFKALGTGISHNNVLDCEVLHNSFGAPIYKLNAKLYAEHKNLSTATIKLSISNTKSMAVAFCVIMGSETYVHSFEQRRL